MVVLAPKKPPAPSVGVESVDVDVVELELEPEPPLKLPPEPPLNEVVEEEAAAAFTVLELESLPLVSVF